MDDFDLSGHSFDFQDFGNFFGGDIGPLEIPPIIGSDFFDTSNISIPTNFLPIDTSNIANVDFSSLYNSPSNFSNIGSFDSGDVSGVNLNNIITDSSGLSSWGKVGADKYWGDDRYGSIMNQANPNVQTYLDDPVFGKDAQNLNAPGLQELTHGGYFYGDPSLYYGLSNPNLSDADRLALYNGVTFSDPKSVA
jgi:hypothetical protein